MVSLGFSKTIAHCQNHFPEPYGRFHIGACYRFLKKSFFHIYCKHGRRKWTLIPLSLHRHQGWTNSSTSSKENISDLGGFKYLVPPSCFNRRFFNMYVWFASRQTTNCSHKITFIEAVGLTIQVTTGASLA